MCELQQKVTCFQGEALEEFNQTLHINGSENNEHVEDYLWGDGLVKASGDFRCFLNQTYINRLVSYFIEVIVSCSDLLYLRLLFDTTINTFKMVKTG